MLFVLFFVSLATAARIDPRIVGGATTTINAHPYQVSIIYKNKLLCGGSIISKQWILTAAHCIDSVTPQMISVRIGSSYYAKGGTLITNIAQVIPHNLYDDRTFDYDVGLIKLAMELILTSTVNTVKLPAVSVTVPTGVKAVVTGWGKTETSDTSDVLQALLVPTIDEQKCSDIFRKSSRRITERMMCAGYLTGGKDACQSDSGGPLVYNNEQIGIVSWGMKCATKDYPGVYTKVSVIRKWIKDNAKVSLRFNNRHICGGAIISEKWIITAAHCVKGSFARFVSIKAGTADLNSRGMVIRAKQIIVHDEYDRHSSDYDIALIELEKPLRYDRRIRPILLPEATDQYSVGSKAVVTGWGVLRSNGALTNHLREVQVPLVSNKDCSQLYRGREITPRMLCAGYLNVGGKDACQGDSGGPLMQYGKLIGIVSWGFGCAEPAYPGVYTRVTTLRSWIAQYTGV
ncbi:hypothetical protein KPH14_003239 [Odynerus spinipes]|uniref:Peptidase S1 domain-containing protein n=1 Tax=Odynerus spinipes TaxID=1348599 RepID=A0AAD9RGK2_9HYME|nr:hypothetical protein KPH14_003239 [Odynerus spinipes]